MDDWFCTLLEVGELPPDRGQETPLTRIRRADGAGDGGEKRITWLGHTTPRYHPRKRLLDRLSVRAMNTQNGGDV